MISAPHSAEHLRDGELRPGEYHTGVLAMLLNESMRCPAIVKTSNRGDDANHDEKSDYKAALREYVSGHGIEYLLDLHQLAVRREADIILGTGRGANIRTCPEMPDIIQKHFAAKGISNIVIDTPFAAAYPYRVASYISRECGISCVQIEINSRLLSDEYDGFAFDRVLSALSAVVNELNARYAQ